VLLPGEDVKFSSPADVGASYETSMRVQLRSIAAGMGITYEQLTGDLTGVNYSSIRAGLLEFRRRCDQFQHQVMVFQTCRPIWRAWIEAAVLAGALPRAEDPAPYNDVKWIPPGFAWVDPLKDIKAQIMAARAGCKSRAEVVSEQGWRRRGHRPRDRRRQRPRRRAGPELRLRSAKGLPCLHTRIWRRGSLTPCC
jgi:lambda family phage portal protein